MAVGNWRRLLGLCGAIGLASVASSGCGGTEVSVAVEAERPPVDPRYATADALVAHCRQLNELSFAAYRDIPSLIYAETEVQQRIVNLIIAGAMFFDFVVALDEVFELPLTEEQRNQGKFFGVGELQIVQRADRRVVAEVKGKPSAGRPQIHFVEYDGRWWLSGYTFEYNADFKKLLDDPRVLEAAELIMPVLNAPAANVAARIRAREFRTPIEAMNAYYIAVEEHVSRTPAAAHQLDRFMRENADLFGFIPKRR